MGGNMYKYTSHNETETKEIAYKLAENLEKRRHSSFIRRFRFR